MQSIFSHLSAIIDFKLSTRKFMHRPKSNKTESSIDYVIEGQNGSSFYVLKQPNNDQCFAFVNKYWVDSDWNYLSTWMNIGAN